MLKPEEIIIHLSYSTLRGLDINGELESQTLITGVLPREGPFANLTHHRCKHTTVHFDLDHRHTYTIPHPRW